MSIEKTAGLVPAVLTLAIDLSCGQESTVTGLITFGELPYYS